MKGLIEAGDKMAAILAMPLTAPVEEWPSEDELNAAIQQWNDEKSKQITAPQHQRDWVGLTDEEINEAYGKAGVIWDHVPHDDVSRIAKAIEARLREKFSEYKSHVFIDHCLWSRNGMTPCPHTVTSTESFINLIKWTIKELESLDDNTAQFVCDELKKHIDGD